MTRFLAVICLALIVWEPACSLAADVVLWEGVLAYFVVPRKRVQDKLGQLQEGGNIENCGPNKLALPEDSILPGAPNAENHVVSLTFGWVNNSYTVQFFIPFLRNADDENGKPIYKLALGSYIDTDGRPFDNPNPCLPIEIADIHHDSNSTRLDVGTQSLLIKPSPLTPVDDALPASSLFESFNTPYIVSSECGCSCQQLTHEPLEQWLVSDVEWYVDGIGIGDASDELSEMTLLTPDASALQSVVSAGLFYIHTNSSCFN